jgi:hypothetical protein
MANTATELFTGLAKPTKEVKESNKYASFPKDSDVTFHGKSMKASAAFEEIRASLHIESKVGETMGEAFLRIYEFAEVKLAEEIAMAEAAKAKAETETKKGKS